jgi:hypothetical protein
MISTFSKYLKYPPLHSCVSHTDAVRRRMPCSAIIRTRLEIDRQSSFARSQLLARSKYTLLCATISTTQSTQHIALRFLLSLPSRGSDAPLWRLLVARSLPHGTRLLAANEAQQLQWLA